MTIGAAGAKASSVNTLGGDGGDSSINFPGGTLTAEGGGAGGRSEVAQASGGPYASEGPGRNGGSGGGAGLYYPKTGGTATGSPFPGTPGNSPDTGWGHAGGRGGQPGSPGNPFYYAGGGGGAGGVGELVEMEHTQMEERVDLVTYSHLTSKYQHQPWHLPHTEIQDRVVVHIG